MSGGPKVGWSDSPHKQGSREWVDRNNKVFIILLCFVQRYSFSISTHLLFALPSFSTSNKQVLHGVQRTHSSEGMLLE